MSTSKGTRFEKSLLPKLQRIWPAVKRAGKTLGMYDKGDYFNTGNWIVEAKHWKDWSPKEWIRTVEKKAEPTQPWMIVFAGDRRKNPPGVYCIVPFDQYINQLEALARLLPKGEE